MTKKRMHANGRGKGGDPYIRHFRWQLSCPAWKALSMTARCLEMELKALYNGSNNGELFLSVREAANRLGIANNTASNAFNELEDAGFIIAKHKGHFKQKVRHASSWILTEFEYNGQLATKDFMKWQPKNKNRPQNLIPTVLKIDTDVQNLIPRKPFTVSKIDTDNA
jgi:hypothetical protein